MFVRFRHSVPKMIFIMPPQVQKCPTFPFSCLNQTSNLPSLRQLNISWTIIGGVCIDGFWHVKMTGIFTQNISLIVWNSFVHACVCVLSSLRHARAENIKVPKNCHIHAHIAARRLSELGSLPHANPPKQSRKITFITRKTMANWYLLTKKWGTVIGK